MLGFAANDSFEDKLEYLRGKITILDVSDLPELLELYRVALLDAQVRIDNLEKELSAIQSGD